MFSSEMYDVQYINRSLNQCIPGAYKILNQSRSVVFDSLRPNGTVHGILQARILEWAAVPFSRGSSQPRDGTQVSSIVGRFFTSWVTREVQEYWTRYPLPSPADLPSQPRDRTRVSCIAGRFFTSRKERRKPFLYKEAHNILSTLLIQQLSQSLLSFCFGEADDKNINIRNGKWW